MIAQALFSVFTATLALAPTALAAVSPTSPSGETVVQVGQPLNAMWTADGTGEWTDTVVQLMTGDNFQMIPLQVLAQNIDGTKDTQASWTTPNVTPYSKIYFLQFTKGGDISTATWTTRFTISGADGNIVPPSNTTSGVQWGIGQLVGSDGQPIPNPTTGNINVVAGGAGSGSESGNSTAAAAGASGASGAVSASGASGPGSGPATISVTTSVSTESASAEPSTSMTSQSAMSSTSMSGSASATRQAAAATSSGAAGQLQVVKGGMMAAVIGLVGAAVW